MSESAEIVVAEDVTPPEAKGPTMPDVGHLMEMALGQGEAGVNALEKLVGLQERIMDRQAENALTDALGAFQDDCPQIAKKQTAKIPTKGGGSYSFSYADLSDIAKAIRPHLKAHGLSYSFDSKMDGVMLTVGCKVRHRDGGTVTATFTCSTETSAAMSGAQKAGAALSYAKRQSLGAALGLITTTADADAEGTQDTGEPISPKQLLEIQALANRKVLDIDKFLAYVGVESLKDIPAANFGMAIRTLKAKKDK